MGPQRSSSSNSLLLASLKIRHQIGLPRVPTIVALNTSRDAQGCPPDRCDFCPSYRCDFCFSVLSALLFLCLCSAVDGRASRFLQLRLLHPLVDALRSAPPRRRKNVGFAQRTFPIHLDQLLFGHAFGCLLSFPLQPLAEAAAELIPLHLLPPPG